MLPFGQAGQIAGAWFGRGCQSLNSIRSKRIAHRANKPCGGDQGSMGFRRVAPAARPKPHGGQTNQSVELEFDADIELELPVGVVRSDTPGAGGPAAKEVLVQVPELPTREPDGHGIGDLTGQRQLEAARI